MFFNLLNLKLMEKVDETFKYFLVEAKGYTKQFSSGIHARRVFAKIEKQAKEEEIAFFVKLHGKENLEDEWVLLDQVDVKKSYYER